MRFLVSLDSHGVYPRPFLSIKGVNALKVVHARASRIFRVPRDIFSIFAEDGGIIFSVISAFNYSWLEVKVYLLAFLQDNLAGLVTCPRSKCLNLIVVVLLYIVNFFFLDSKEKSRSSQELLMFHEYNMYRQLSSN